MLPPEVLEEKRQQLVTERRRKRVRNRRVTLFIGIAFLTLVLASVTALLTVRRGIQKSDASLPQYAEESSRINVLVMGADIRTEDTGRSDTLMLASFDPKTGNVGILSVPRDTRVHIPGTKGYSKINAAFAIGGPQKVKETVSELLNVRIDYYVVLDFAGFEKVVDTLGGVTIDVAKRMYYVDRAQMLIIDLQQGPQHLDGRRALGYVRFRHDRLGDIALVDAASGQYEGRVERQLQFVKALAKQALRPENLFKLPKLVKQVYAAIDTDIPLERMAALGLSARKVKPDLVQTFVLPGVAANKSGISYWIVDEDSVGQVIADMVGGDHERLPEREPVRVAVLNGSGVSGVAGKAADKLRQEGYNVVSVGNAGKFDYQHTQVIAQGADTDAAAMVAKALGVNPARKGKDTSDIGDTASAEVAVIIGRDISDSLVRSN